MKRRAIVTSMNTHPVRALDPLRLVLVPMVGVGGMAVAFVDVVVVIPVAHRLVPAVVAVRVFVGFVDHVDIVGALVDVVIVDAVDVAIMQVVGVVAMGYGYVSAPHAVAVLVVCVRLVGSGHDALLLLFSCSFGSSVSVGSDGHGFRAVSQGVVGDVSDVLVGQGVSRLLAAPGSDGQARVAKHP